MTIKQMISFVLPARMRPLLIVLLGMAVAALACLQALDFPFISDDNVYLANNLPLRQLQLDELWRLLVQPFNPYEFLPLRDFSYWLDLALFGLSPAAMRVHNMVLYLLSCVLVYGVTLQVWRYFNAAQAASAPWAAAAVTALFAIHPAHVEAVVWISGRKDVLSGLFAMLALWLALHARREQGLSARYAAASVTVLLAAMLAKATAVAVAPLIALLWLMFWRDMPAMFRRRSLLLWPVGILLAAVCMAIIFAANSTIRNPAYWGMEAGARALAVLGWLARLAVSAEDRHFFYPVFEDTGLSAMIGAGGGVLLAGVAGALMLWRKRPRSILPLAGFALAAFVLLCLPYTQLLPYQTHSLVTDRFLFLAVWPVALLLVALAWRLPPAPRTALLLVIALLWAVQTVKRPGDWRSFERLADADLRAYPGLFVPAAIKVMAVQLPRGLYDAAYQTAATIRDVELRQMMNQIIRADYAVYAHAWSSGNPQQAIASLIELDGILKQSPVAVWTNTPRANALANVRAKRDNGWQYLIKHFPDDVAVHYNAGLWLLDARNFVDAATHLRAATESQQLPESNRGHAYHSLGLALIGGGHIAAAEIPLRAALEHVSPDTAAYCALAQVYRDSGRNREAERAETECHDRAPGVKPTP